MIDARVDDAVKQHLQKMDWLHGEEEALGRSLTPPPPGSSTSGGKIGFTLPLSEAPQAEEMIAPVLEINSKQEGESEPPPPPLDADSSAEGKTDKDCKEAFKEESTAESLDEPAASTKEEKEDKTVSSPPPKDGTPV